ncbi:hypothetical protein D3C85_1228110 [compost metagenome]
MGPRCAVDARTADRQLDAIVARRLGEYPGLVGQYILVAGNPALPYTLHVHQVAGARHFVQAFAGGGQVVLLLIGDQHLAQLDRRCRQGGLGGSESSQQAEAGWWGQNATHCTTPGERRMDNGVETSEMPLGARGKSTNIAQPSSDGFVRKFFTSRSDGAGRPALRKVIADRQRCLAQSPVEFKHD